MQRSDIYAVVDLETTGANIEEDALIQIGCVFVQNGITIDRFVTDINPNRTLSPHIQQLTKITNEQLARAPYFEEVAADLYQRLQGCVFVAHNVHFDYQFLNESFSRVGLPRLNILAIDTVELAQIFYPRLPSFRLTDIANELQLTHERPHQADSDAEVTAQLLQKITDKALSLPLVTLERITVLSTMLAFDTREFLQMLLAESRQQKKDLPEDLFIHYGIALRKKEVFLNEKIANPEDYPKTRADKQRIFAGEIEYRDEQVKMMDEVFDYFSQKTKNRPFVLEAPTGSGKTIGYLYPLSYLATSTNPVVVSTRSILLEEQLMLYAVPEVNRLHPDALQATLVKSHRHYLDLTRFAETLSHPVEQKQYLLYQMGVLVWLTETVTGDLTELQLANYEHLFFEHVRHRGEQWLIATDPFYDVDFYRHLKERQRVSNVIIVNHAYLIEEDRRETFQLPCSDFLIIDEAHHLPDMLWQRNQATSNKRLLFYQVTELLKGPELSVAQLLKHDEWGNLLQHMTLILTEIHTYLEHVFSDITEIAQIDYGLAYGETYHFKPDEKRRLPLYLESDLANLLSCVNELQELINEAKETFESHQEKWLLSERLAFSRQIELLEQFIERFRILQLWQDDVDTIFWIRLEKKHENVVIGCLSKEKVEVTEQVWYQRYRQCLLTGGTLQVNRDFHFLMNQLGIQTFQELTLKEPYAYDEQACIMTLEDSQDYFYQSPFVYAKYLSRLITAIAREKKGSMLVLFTSHEQLAKVYQMTHEVLLQEGIEVYAQSISGTNERITKQFKRKPNSILLGTDTFWEGIDLPRNELEILMITRLPFESPERLSARMRLDEIERAGGNGFYNYTLPKATLRLRQGVGRLIRSIDDRGIIIMTDPRFTRASYASMMQRSLPRDLPIHPTSSDDSATDVRDFFENVSSERDN